MHDILQSFLKKILEKKEYYRKNVGKIFLPFHYQRIFKKK